MTTFVSNGGDHPFGDGQSGNLPEDLDTILSNALFKLSVGERNSIDEEFHGVSTLAPKESPELLKSKLLELSDELDLISDDCPLKAAYIESQQYHETYTNTDDFRLRFLRCELFDAKKAATRLIKFLSFASDIFGPELLRRPIRFSDLTKEEVKIFRSGDIQMLPYRDQAGRPVAVWVGGFDIAPHVKTRVRGNKKQKQRDVRFQMFWFRLSYILELILIAFLFSNHKGATKSISVLFVNK